MITTILFPFTWIAGHTLIALSSTEKINKYFELILEKWDYENKEATNKKLFDWKFFWLDQTLNQSADLQFDKIKNVRKGCVLIGGQIRA